MGWLLLTMLILSVVITIALNVPVVQNRLMDKAFVHVQNLFGTQVKFDDVRYRLFNRVEFSEFLLLDMANDTLLYAPIFRGSFPGLIKKFTIDETVPVRLRSLYFEDAYIRLYTDSTREVNLRFIPDTIKAKRRLDKIPEPFLIDNIQIENSILHIHRYDGVGVESGIDLKQLTFNDFNLEVSNLKAIQDTLNISIDQLSFTEQSGFQINEFRSNLYITSQKLHFNEVEFFTPYSKMNLNKVHFDFNKFNDFALGGIIDKVDMNVDCATSLLNTKDLGFFSKIFWGVENELFISGNFYGRINNLNARDVNLKYGDNSFLKGRFDIVGLPNPENTFLIFDTDQSKIMSTDLRAINLPDNKKINLPDVFNDVQYYAYKGNFTGFFNDFVSYGEVHTDLGDGTIDIMFRPDTSNTVNFSGRLQTDDFSVGELAGLPETVGKADLDLIVDGLGTVNKGFNVDIKGLISEIEINKYTYEEIEVDGLFAQKKFQGQLKVNDPNLRLSFDGLFDLSSEIRTYNFTANVLKANLYTLNIHKKDPNYSASFLLYADLKGNTIDEINGDIKLLNSLFSKTDAQIQVYDLGINIRNDSIQNELVVKSDFFDGHMEGKFRLSSLGHYYLSLVDNYLPALNLSKQSLDSLNHAHFNYEVNFKNSRPLFSFFTPHYYVAPNTFINGELKRDTAFSSKLHVESSQIKLKNSELSHVILNSNSNSNEFIIDFGCTEFNASKRISLENFTLLSKVGADNIEFESRWINWDSTLSRGDVNGSFSFDNLPGEKTAFHVALDSSKIVVNDSLWLVEPFQFRYDSTSIELNAFHVAHNNEFIKVEGKLTDIKEDSLMFLFNDFNFANLNYFTRSSTFKFGGILNGDASIQGLSRPLFFAELFVDNLVINDEQIGDTYFDTRWNQQKESIQIDADVHRDQIKTVNVTGDIYPQRNGELNLAFNLNGFGLGFINPYLRSVFSDIEGETSGILTLSGTVKAPKLNGTLDIENAGLTVDYLNTRYTFDSEIGFNNNNIVFDQLSLYDKFNNAAILNGIIRSDNLKDFNLNINVQPQQFLCLNTSSYDNNAYYGTAYATGLVRIQGPTSQLKFNITATTEHGTEFSIPLSDKAELSEFDFIRIVESDTIEVDELEEVYTANISGMQLDFNLNVTPSAEVKIIFDPTLGDEITARGTGDLRIAINSLGDFRMLGDYVIESGDYLFTMKDILFNRKFKVVEGSRLQWTGDPVNANVDINTFYRTKARLGDLTGDSVSTYRYSVDCELAFDGRLKEPNIKYGINLPYAEQEEKDKLDAIISSEEELSKQFLSLLVLSRFLPAQNNANNSDSDIGGSTIAGVNASELLSNQFSNWLSQLSDEFDIGVNYRPGTELSPQELELALSTQLLNDRLSINGSIDMKTNAEADNAQNIPNLDLDYKITKSGKLRARAFNRANDNEIVTVAPYTQGLGMFYTEEFDKFSEIRTNHRNKRNSRKKNKKSKDATKEAVLREDDSNDIE